MRHRFVDDATGCDVEPAARTLTKTAESLHQLLYHETPPRDRLLEQALHLEDQMQTLRQAVRACPRRQALHLLNRELQQAIDGQTGELTSRVEFIALHAGWKRLPDHRLAAYINGLLTDVRTLLDLLGFAP